MMPSAPAPTPAPVPIQKKERVQLPEPINVCSVDDIINTFELYGYAIIRDAPMTIEDALSLGYFLLHNRLVLSSEISGDLIEYFDERNILTMLSTFDAHLSFVIGTKNILTLYHDPDKGMVPNCHPYINVYEYFAKHKA